MTWQITPISVITMLAAVAAGATAIETWRHRSARGGLQLALLLVAITEWCASVTLESAAVGIPAKVFWSKAEYVGLTCSITLLLQFALVYSQQDRWLARWRIHLLWAIPATFILLAWTNELHGLLWPSLVMAPGEGNVLIYGHGPVFFVGGAFYTLVMLLSAALLLIPMHNMPRLY
ncbi:MAG TPA: histidine kinase N-terminal 7TM domain-containing protein, partial [Chloroflexota bacterium]|nr:histidine kinase N-terminal 7TM domain-containing protein [Chloroflexota bacterium]